MRFTYRLKQLILLIGDICIYIGALWMSIVLRNVTIPSAEQFLNHFPVFGFTFVLWTILNYINGLYDVTRFHIQKLSRILPQTALISLIVGALFFYILPQSTVMPKTILLLNVVIGYGISALWRILFRKLIGHERLMAHLLFVGYTKEVEELLDIIKKNPGIGYKPTAIVDPDLTFENTNASGIDVYRGLHTIRPAITTHKIDHVIISPSLRTSPDAMRELYELLFWDVHLYDLPTFYEIITGRIPPSIFSEGWFLDHLKNKHQPLADSIRAIMQIIIAPLLGIIFIVTFPIIAISIRLNSKGPIFLKQERVGQGEQRFTLYKYRSMYALSSDGSAEVAGVEFATKDDKRITVVGKIMRRTHLDELPQIINVFKRNINIIGPRPERPEIVQKLTSEMSYYPLRHILKPGLTGWALLHQNYTDTLEKSLQKLQYDLYYIKNKSILLDLSILLRTVNVVTRMMGQ